MNTSHPIPASQAQQIFSSFGFENSDNKKKIQCGGKINSGNTFNKEKKI